MASFYAPADLLASLFLFFCAHELSAKGASVWQIKVILRTSLMAVQVIYLLWWLTCGKLNPSYKYIVR